MVQCLTSKCKALSSNPSIAKNKTKTKTKTKNLYSLKGKFIAMSAYTKRTERAQINDLMLHLKLLEKQEQAKPKTSRRREIIKIRTEINEIEIKKTIQ
jgi:hypothetical protein